MFCRLPDAQKAALIVIVGALVSPKTPPFLKTIVEGEDWHTLRIALSMVIAAGASVPGDADVAAVGNMPRGLRNAHFALAIMDTSTDDTRAAFRRALATHCWDAVAGALVSAIRDKPELAFCGADLHRAYAPDDQAPCAGAEAPIGVFLDALHAGQIRSFLSGDLPRFFQSDVVKATVDKSLGSFTGTFTDIVTDVVGHIGDGFEALPSKMPEGTEHLDPAGWVKTKVAACPGEAFVADLPAPPPGQPFLYEFSVKVGPSGLARWGRFGVWVPGDAAERVRAWLDLAGAPAPVLAASAAPAPRRFGLAVENGAAGAQFRLYLDRGTGQAHAPYQAWRWRSGETAELCDYEFHFAPETPTGLRPTDLAPDWSAPLIAAISRSDRFAAVSGFWLRRRGDTAPDQLDLALPWQPNAAETPGLAAWLADLPIAASEKSWLLDLPIRHLAVPLGVGAPNTATLYVSGRLAEGPGSESRLQAWTAAAAAAEGRAALGWLEGGGPLERDDAAAEHMDRFYSGPVELWASILGPGLHYHNALFENDEADPDDETMLAALRRAVSDLYPFIAPGERVYDIGCGWGGPLGMLVRERGCDALGLTVARTQYRYVAGLGLPVRYGDAERTVPPGRFDVALLLESFEHISDKPSLLRRLRRHADRLVMRVNCQQAAPTEPRFGGTMHMTSAEALRELVEAAGWRIEHWRDRRPESLPSVAVWRRRLNAIPPGGDEHIEVHRMWCERVWRLGADWGRQNPLIELAAT